MGDENCKQAFSMAQMWLLDDFGGYRLRYLTMPH
jgi:hypothetical protein